MSSPEAAEASTWSNLPPKMRGGQSFAPKRSIAVSSSMANIPALPKLTGDIILEVFTHKSLRFEGAPRNEEVGDSDRLAELGAKVLEMAVCYALFNKRPMLEAEEIEKQTKEALSDDKIEGWITLYRLREKLRCTPDAFPSLRTPKEVRHLFNSYVGAVFVTSGLRVVQNWITKLVDPESEPPPVIELESDQSSNAPAAKRQRTDPIAMNMSPPPPVMAPPPLPPSQQPTMSYLQLFNQTANQRRLAVEYPATFVGPPHAGSWTVTCRVNGVDRGHGSGQSKQVAKEMAAQQAFFALGWGQPPGGRSMSVDSESHFQPKVEPAESPLHFPPPPAMPPPPLPAQPNPLAPAQPSVAFLPIFNQTAAQRRHQVEYPAEFVGPAHAGSWSVRCIVDGIEKGHGTGTSKQLAKEEAAKQAYYNMGWAPRG